MKKTTVKFSFPHYNGQFHIKMEGPALNLVQFTQKEKRPRGVQDAALGTFKLRKHECAVPIYTFGFLADNPEFKPGHGGEWSSNPTTINRMFGIQLVEVIYNNSFCAIPLEWLKEKLDDLVWFNGTEIINVALSETIVEAEVNDNETFEPKDEPLCFEDAPKRMMYSVDGEICTLEAIIDTNVHDEDVKMLSDEDIVTLIKLKVGDKKYIGIVEVERIS